MRQRYYNPEIKRFVNQDILTGSMGNSQSLNRYSYVQGNPVSYTDPFGLSPLGGLFTGTGLAHGVLGVLGCLPGIPGAVFNGIDAWVYATIDKDYFMAAMAGLSAVSLGMGSIAKWAGTAAKTGTRGAKALGYMSTIGSCMSNGIEFAQNGIQTAVAAYDAWNTYTQTGSADAGTVASIGLSALGTVLSGGNLSKSSKTLAKALNEDGVTGKFKQKASRLSEIGDDDRPLSLKLRDEEEVNIAMKIAGPSTPEVFRVFGHGDSTGIKNNGRLLNVDQVAYLIQNSPSYIGGKQKVILYSCETGKEANGFAQQLANKLGVEVEAPNDLLYPTKTGTFVIADKNKKNRGDWVTFTPKKNE